MTQEEVAELARVSRSEIAMLELGRRTTPSLRVLRGIGRALKIPVAWLREWVSAACGAMVRKDGRRKPSGFVGLNRKIRGALNILDHGFGRYFEQDHRLPGWCARDVGY